MNGLVTSVQDVVGNVLTLSSYRASKKEDLIEFHDGLMRKGRLFVVDVYEGRYAFAPSRFAGYQSNTYKKHTTRSISDGKVTNPALIKLLGKPLDGESDRKEFRSLYRLLDNGFNDFCKKSRIVPDNIPNPRKYWPASCSVALLMTRNIRDSEIDQGDAINDLGTDCPLTRQSNATTYKRDSRIRKKVILRANGVCEYCGNRAFLDDSEQSYLECHHIIALANEGPDRMTNVIALCANDHREAHFGKRRRELEKEMIKKVRRLQLS